MRAEVSRIENVRVVGLLRFHSHNMLLAGSMAGFASYACHQLIKFQLSSINSPGTMTTKTLLSFRGANRSSNRIIK
jgi:hypothetical protein